MRVGLVEQVKHLADERLYLPAVMNLHDMQLVPPEHHVGKLLQAFVGFLGHAYQVFNPVNILLKAEARKLLVVIGMVIIGDEHALPVKALDEHPLAVKVAKTERPVYLRAAALAPEILDGLEQRVHNLVVVDKINLRKANAFIVEFLVRLVADYCAYAPDYLAVAIRQKAFCVAILERGILFPVPVLKVVCVCGGNEVRIILIKLVWIIDKFTKLALRRNLFYSYHT